MLSQSDIEWIRANRAEITEGRTELVEIVRLIDGEPDPYTGEVNASEIRESVSVVWTEISTVSNGDRDVVNGIELCQDDVQLTFEPDVDLTGVKTIEREGVSFTIFAVDEKGIGTVNRRECFARRTT
jgi:hypothetical protein